MIDFQTLWTVALAEMRVSRRLVRTWIFLALGGLVMFATFAYYAFIHSQFSFFSATIAWINPRYFMGVMGFWLCHVFLLGAIFLAFEVRARDTRERLAEVLDAKPISNVELLGGRTLGLLLTIWPPAIVLGLLLTGVASLVGAPIEPWSMLVFVALMTLPGFAFFIPLTMFVTLLVRVRIVAAVLMIVILGTSITLLFVMPFAWGQAVDLTGSFGLDLPSDLAPTFAPLRAIAERILLVVAGLGFLLLAAAIHPRRDEGSRGLRIGLGAGALLAALVVFGLGVLERQSAIDERLVWRDAHAARADDSRPDLEAIDATVTIDPGSALSWTARVEGTAPADAPLDELLFTLNPGLQPAEVTVDGAAAPFTHTNGLFVVKPARPVPAGGRFTLAMNASGVFDTEFGYVDAVLDPLQGTVREFQSLFILGDEPAVFTNDFATLLPGTAWLLRAGPDAMPSEGRESGTDLSRVRLTVDVPQGFLVAGPGAREEASGAPSGMVRFVFDAGAPMPAPALVAGRYESRRIDVDGVVFEILVDPAHTANFEALAPAEDALVAKLREKLERARSFGLAYPYDGFTIAEVPTRLRGFGDGWRLDTTLAPPAMGLIRESGFPTARFDRRFADPESFKDAEGGREGEMVRHLERFFSYDFGGGNVLTAAARGLASHQLVAQGAEAATLDFLVETVAMDLVLETKAFFSAYLYDRDLNQTIGGAIFGTLTSQGERSVTDVILEASAGKPSVWDDALGTALAKLEPRENPKRTLGVLNLKGRAMAQAMLETFGRETTGRALAALVETRRGQAFTRADLAAALAGAGADPGTFFEDWLDETALAGFEASDATVARLPDSGDGASRYQTLVSVHNSGGAPGFARIRVLAVDEENRQSFASPPARLAPGESSEFGVVSAVPPTGVRVEPFLALNRGPFAVRVPPIDETVQDGAEPFAGSRATEWRPRQEAVIAVDDLDPEFTPEAVEKKDWLTSLRGGGDDPTQSVEAEERDGGLLVQPLFSPPGLPEWRRIAHPTAWGRYRRTFAIAPAGDGGVRAVFRGSIVESGSHRLEIHLPSLSDVSPVYAGLDPGTWVLRVTDRTGDNVLRFTAKGAKPGWNEVGLVSLAAGEVTIAYTNQLENGGKIVIADAIRLVRAARAPGETR